VHSFLKLVKVFTSVNSRHVREVVVSAKEGGPSLDILSGLVAGNFSAYWLGGAIVALMTVAYLIGTHGLGVLMLAPAVFSFGLVAFGFLGMGPVTIAVDSYGPVTDNAQSVYELSTIEQLPGAADELKRDFGIDRRLGEGQALAGGQRRGRQHLQGDRQAGADRHRGRRRNHDDLLHHHGPDEGPDRRRAEPVDPASTIPARHDHGRRDHLLVQRRLHPGRHHRLDRAVEFIKENIQLEGVTKASVEDSRRSCRSAPSTPSGACSTSSWASSSRPWPSRSWSRTSSSAT